MRGCALAVPAVKNNPASIKAPAKKLIAIRFFFMSCLPFTHF
jgi:hypothetical protein